MSVGIDYELRRPFEGNRVAVLAELSGDLQIEYQKLSADRITISIPPNASFLDDLLPLTEITLYVRTPGDTGERVPFARGWLMRKLVTPTVTMYEFRGARQLLNLVPVQGILTPTQTVEQAVEPIITRAKQVLASETNGVNISDWAIGTGIDSPAPFLQVLAPVSATQLIEQIERALGDWMVVTFGFPPSPAASFTVTAQPPPAEVLLLDTQVTEWDERYEWVFNRVRYLMHAPANRNILPNPDFADAVVSVHGESATNLVDNPSFEVLWSSWTLPSPPIYYEWEWSHGYTGTHSFCFHDCHEYDENGWLSSALFNVVPGEQYSGGFALGCAPSMAQECGGPSTVKVRVQVLGFDSGNSQTEVAYDQQVTGIFHTEFHWHWVRLTPFTFANSNTVKARIRFNTFHGKRLYLDEVRVHRAYQIYQQHWVLQPDTGSPPLTPGTDYSIDWLRPLGVSEGKHVMLTLALPQGRWVELQSSVSQLLVLEPVYTATLFSNGATPTVYIDWYNEQGSLISTATPTMTAQDTLQEDGITWTRYTSNALSAPVGARDARMRLRWTGVSAQSRIRCVLLTPAPEPRPYRYGYAVSQQLRAGDVPYRSSVDPDLKREAQDSENTYGVLPALRVSDTVIDAASAEMQAETDFLRFAIPERRIVAEGATLDYRLLYPHRYRLRVPSVVARSLLLLSLTIRANGQWVATLGTPQPDLAQLLSYLLQHQQSKH